MSSSALRSALCPVVPPHRAVRPVRAPRSLSYSLTLPGELRSAAVARASVGAVLAAHGLERFLLPAQVAVSELAATLARLTPGKDLYVSVRHRGDALRLVVWDQHPTHRDPGAERLCGERRSRALWLLAAVVEDWGGEWGVRAAAPPQAGTKTWVTLPR